MPNRKPIILGGVNVPSPELVELAGYVGFDAVMLDMEHGAIGVEAMQQLVRAGDAADIPVLGRIPVHAADLIQKSLDAGVAGLIFPHIENRSEAETAYRLTRYPPRGWRGVGYARAYQYASTGGSTAREIADDGLLVGMQIETKEGVKNAGEILSVDGVDFGMVGRADLAVDLGIKEPKGPAMNQIIFELGGIGKRLGKPLGGGIDIETIETDQDSGYSILYVGLMAVLAKEANAIRARVEQVRARGQ